MYITHYWSIICFVVMYKNTTNYMMCRMNTPMTIGYCWLHPHFGCGFVELSFPSKYFLCFSFFFIMLKTFYEFSSPHQHQHHTKRSLALEITGTPHNYIILIFNYAVGCGAGVNGLYRWFGFGKLSVYCFCTIILGLI